MRSSRSALLPSSSLATFNFATLILCVLIFSTLSFAAAPDRITGPIDSQQLIKLSAGVPMQAQPKYDQGPVDPSLKLSYMTLLTVPSASQQQAITQLMAEQQNPQSALYHKWLTPEQYAERFGLSPNDANKITAWLQSQGFTIVHTARGRSFIVFSGTAAQVERTFQTAMHSFNINGQTYFANTTPPLIPAALSGIVTGFHGFNNFRAKSQIRQAQPGYTYASGGKDYYFLAPGDITAIYDVSTLQNLNGTGQTLAVVGETGIYQSDLTNFRQNFGLSAISCTVSSDIITACNTPNFEYILVNGSATDVYSDLAEADLDIEWSGATAPNAKVIFVNATDPNGDGVWDSWYYAVDNIVAPVITMSYTAPCELFEAETPDGEGTVKPNEGTFASDEAELKQASLAGITFMNSAGDTGAAECDNFNFTGINTAIYGYAVGYPASSQYVTGVGGTLIPATDPDEYSPTYWNSSNGTGGASAKAYIQEQPWNESEEFGLICTVADPCTLNGGTVTSWETAQAAIGIEAGGGGVSNCVTIDGNLVCQAGFPQPSWQSGISASAINPSGFGVTSTPARYSPDVSLLASPDFPGYILCTQQFNQSGDATGSSCNSPSTGVANMISGCIAGTGPCTIVGGTSASSPVFAGMVTMLNQYLGATGGLGPINPILYELAASNSTNKAFHPVTTASPGVYSDGAFCQPGDPMSGVAGDPWPAALVCPSSGANAGFLGFTASDADPTTNYNLVTGLGSVDADNLAIAWAAEVAPGFTLSAAPSTLSIAQGNDGTSTITVTPVNGFTGSVSFEATGLPSGVTASFNPTSTTTTSVLTLTASASAAVGTVTVTITGTSGSLTPVTTTISLTVVSEPTFTLSAAPTSVTITPTLAGGTSTITVTDLAGFTGTVSLAVTSVLPTGVTASFNPTSTTTKSVLTLTASASAQPGTTTVTITGTSGSLTATTSISLTVTPAPSFTLTAAPTSVTITPTLAGGTSTITVVPANGFTGSVGMAASGLPTGVTASFNPASTTTTSTLTLTASASANKPGTYPITITGTSGSVTANTTIMLTVTPPPNFTLSDTALAGPINPGGTGNSGTSTVTVNPTNGFTGSVSLAVTSGLPSGVTPVFTPNPTTGTSTLTLTASSSATPGTVTLTITGTSGTLTPVTTTLALTINQDFTFSNIDTTPGPALAGESTQSGFTMTATNGSTFVNAVTFACNLPAGIVGVGCSNFSTIAAGASSPQTVTFAINTTGPNKTGGADMRRRRADNRSPWLPLSLPLAGIVMAGFAGHKVWKHSALASLCVALALLGVLVACGGSSTPPIAVTVSPSGATLYPNYAQDNWPSQTQQFTATLTNTTNTAVTWNVPTTDGGTITSGGLYTAPTIAVGLPATATVQATSQADMTKVGQAVVTFTPTTVPTAIVGSPYSITVTATDGATQNTTANIALTVQ